MTHLSPDRLIAIAEGAPMRRAEARHCSSCAACTHEIEAVTRLLERVQSIEEVPLDDGLMDTLSSRIDARIATLENRPASSVQASFRWGMLALPLAAAATLVLLPRTRDSSWRSCGFPTEAGAHMDLTAEQYDAVMHGLASPLDELSVAATVLSSRTAPLNELESLSNEELERLLELMPRHNHG